MTLTPDLCCAAVIHFAQRSHTLALSIAPCGPCQEAGRRSTKLPCGALAVLGRQCFAAPAHKPVLDACAYNGGSAAHICAKLRPRRSVASIAAAPLCSGAAATQTAAQPRTVPRRLLQQRRSRYTQAAAQPLTERRSR